MSKLHLLYTSIQTNLHPTFHSVLPNMHPIQQAFWDEAGLQCGYCAPGIVLSSLELIQDNHNPSTKDMEVALAGNLCRCTGYQSIKRSVTEACVRMYPEEK